MGNELTKLPARQLVSPIIDLIAFEVYDYDELDDHKEETQDLGHKGTVTFFFLL